MEFITEEVRTELGLTEEQIKGIAPLYESNVAELKKGWDGKANENAEAILNGASTKVFEVTKVERKQGEKVADYIVRASNEHLSTLQTDLSKAKTEYEQKLKDFQGDNATKAELDQARKELDDAKKLLADFDTYKDKAEKYEPLQNEYNSMKLSVAYAGVKPSFSQEVNPYEAKAKWADFVAETNEKYNIEIVDGEAIAIDKSNEHKRVKLSELVAQNKEITELMQGRRQEGSGARGKSRKIENVPFEVPENASSADISKAINEYLDSQGIKKTDKDRGKKFAEYHSIITKAK